MSRLAILAFAGDLPPLLAQARPEALYVTFDGSPHAPPGAETFSATLSHLADLFRRLQAARVTEVVLAGAVPRPPAGSARFDAETRAIAPDLAAALPPGNARLLRSVVALIEGQGLALRAPQDIRPDLLAPQGRIAGPAPTEAQQADIARARAILTATGPLDIGQGVVVAGGRCLGVEAAPGTDALLRHVADTRCEGRGGLLLKAPTPGQDRRVDLPAIGPRTVALAQEARLDGIAVTAGGALLIGRAATVAAAEQAGLFLHGTAP